MARVTEPEGLTGYAVADFVVCDRCGYLWDIDRVWHDPIVCPACQQHALWRFPELRKAREHAALVREASWRD